MLLLHVATVSTSFEFGYVKYRYCSLIFVHATLIMHFPTLNKGQFSISNDIIMKIMANENDANDIL